MPEIKKNLTQLVEHVSASEISSIQSIVSCIVRIINDPKASINDLRGIISLDPPLMVKILRIANSAFYAPVTPIHSLQQAVIMIGLESLYELALNQKVCQLFTKTDMVYNYSRKSLWKHSIATALISKMIYRREYRDKGETVYIVGLLHNIGIIVLDQFLQDTFKDILRLEEEKELNFIEAEKHYLPFSHYEIGAEVAKRWNLPEEIPICMLFHHNPTMAPLKYQKMAAVIYLADYACDYMNIGYGDAHIRDKAEIEKCFEIAMIQPFALKIIAGEVSAKLEEMEKEGLL